MTVDLKKAERHSAALLITEWVQLNKKDARDVGQCIADLIAEVKRLQNHPDWQEQRALKTELDEARHQLAVAKGARDEARRQLADLQACYDRAYANGWNDAQEQIGKLTDLLVVAKENAQIVCRYHWGDGSVTREQVIEALGKIGVGDE